MTEISCFGESTSIVIVASGFTASFASMEGVGQLPASAFVEPAAPAVLFAAPAVLFAVPAAPWLVPESAVLPAPAAFPELVGGAYDGVTVKQIIAMTSGADTGPMT